MYLSEPTNVIKAVKTNLKEKNIKFNCILLMIVSITRILIGFSVFVHGHRNGECLYVQYAKQFVFLGLASVYFVVPFI